jgi:hypothetical protein
MLILAAAVVVAACARTDAETEIRSLLERAEAAVEQRQTGFFRELLSDNYVDRAGRNKDSLIDQIRGYFFVNPGIEVIKYIEEIRLDGETAAEVVLRLAVVGARGGSLTEIDADFYRLELELERARDGWQIIGAGWGRAAD